MLEQKKQSVRWVEYHYSYQGSEYTGKGRAGDFDEHTPQNTPFTIHISRINPKYSYHGDLRTGIVPPLLFLSIAVAIVFLGFNRPDYSFNYSINYFTRYNYFYKTVQTDRVKYPYIAQRYLKVAPPNCSSKYNYVDKLFNEDNFENASISQRDSKHNMPIEWEAHGFDISAIGMTNMPKRPSLNSGMQYTTLHIENDSLATIQVNQLRQNGTPVPQTMGSHINIPSGGRCDWPLAGPIPWQFVRGSTVLGILVSTPQAGYVRILDMNR